MTDDLDQLCRSLKLRKISEILDRELSRAEKQSPSYADFLARLLREEYHDQADRRLRYRITQARLPEHWTLESFPFEKQPGVNATQIRQLAELDFISRTENIVFISETGRGKTGLATGIAIKAMENGYRARFIKAQDLFDEMYASLADRSTKQLLNHLVRFDLLLIDELGYLNLNPEHCNIFFRLMDERYARNPTIITTNLEYEEWYGLLGNKSMVNALLSRLRHRCHTIRIDGPSLRDPTV